jgi:hypothetical protein
MDSNLAFEGTKKILISTYNQKYQDKITDKYTYVLMQSHGTKTATINLVKLKLYYASNTT